MRPYYINFPVFCFNDYTLFNITVGTAAWFILTVSSWWTFTGFLIFPSTNQCFNNDSIMYTLTQSCFHFAKEIPRSEIWGSKEMFNFTFSWLLLDHCLKNCNNSHFCQKHNRGSFCDTFDSTVYCTTLKLLPVFKCKALWYCYFDFYVPGYEWLQIFFPHVYWPFGYAPLF